MTSCKVELRWLALAVLALLAIALWTAPAAAQFPEKFTNLQVLPKDISREQLQSTMRGFAFGLGVRCDHCHVEKSDDAKQSGLNYAADDKQTKKTARVMLQMVAAINRDYISKVSDMPAEPVKCVTCHRGLAQPRTLNSVLTDTIEEKGVDSALAQYQHLRQKYYGTGEYDFGETPLNQLTESLLAQKKTKEAVAVMEMNFASNHPDSLYAYHMLAQAHQANGQIEKALADYRKVLELHPDDDWAKEQIRSLSHSK